MKTVIALRIGVRRVYAPRGDNEGVRVLVDRLWPRGLTKDQLGAEQWLREVAPSTALRQWFGHDPTRWEEFKRRYFDELKDKPQAIRSLLALAETRGVTLLFAARDLEHNQAVALRDYLLARADQPKGEAHASDR